MTELVEVTQEDREAAAKMFEDGSTYGAMTAELARSGGCDKDRTVQAFARHRINALSPPTVRDGVLEEAAKVAECYASGYPGETIATAIRALKSQPSS